jgi:hypothetical protein
MRSSLSDIHDLESLLLFLRDDLDWPIGTDSVEDVLFDFQPEADLGLPAEVAARITAIRQLRPMVRGQPWGVFYVEFEQRYLPLRLVQRVLLSLCTRSRGSAAALRKLWEPRDVLMIASSGSAKARRFDFAQCTAARGNQRDVLVLGWQNEEPEPRLDWIEAQIREGLRWPGQGDPDAVAAWPARWRETFLARRARPRAIWSELSNAQQRTLIDLYAAGDNTVDVLPYTADFSWLLDSFNRATGLSLTPHEFWRALSTARKGGHLPRKERMLPPSDRD